jgi:hypothetical protein
LTPCRPISDGDLANYVANCSAITCTLLYMFADCWRDRRKRRIARSQNAQGCSNETRLQSLRSGAARATLASVRAHTDALKAIGGATIDLGWLYDRQAVYLKFGAACWLRMA